MSTKETETGNDTVAEQKRLIDRQQRQIETLEQQIRDAAASTSKKIGGLKKSLEDAKEAHRADVKGLRAHADCLKGDLSKTFAGEQDRIQVAEAASRKAMEKAKAEHKSHIVELRVSHADGLAVVENRMSARQTEHIEEMRALNTKIEEVEKKANVLKHQIGKESIAAKIKLREKGE